MISNIPQIIIEISNALEKGGFEAYVVGGGIRDLILKKTPKDWDITTNATPEQIQAIFPNSFYDNKFGTVSIKNETEEENLKIVQITPYRIESDYSDFRRPENIAFGTKIEDDLKRRDFTINALAYRTKTGDLIDLYKGQEDLKKKILKTVGNPDERFNEDALRILRAIRFAAELNLVVSQETGDSILKNGSLLAKISKERIRDEFTKLILSDDPEYGLILLKQYKLLPYIIPELEEGVGMEQNQAHAYDVWTHLLKSVQAAAAKKWPLEIRLAALLHDIGKPNTRRKGAGVHKWTFYGHDVVGARMAKKILTELKFSKEITDKVTKLVRWHMFFSDTEQITLSAVRRLVAEVGKDSIWDLMNLRVCDRIGTGRPKESPYRLRKYHSMIEEVQRDPISVGMLKIDGEGVQKAANIAPGPRIGWILHALLEEVLDDPKKNTTEFLKNRTEELSKIDDASLRKIGEAGKSAKEKIEEAEIEKIRNKHHVR